MPGLDNIDGAGLREDEMLVYIAGPYTNGSWGDNISSVIEEAQLVLEAGHVPFIPHTMTALWSTHYSNEWIKFDLKWLDLCDALIRVDGYSEGADTEVEFAKESGIDVYDSAIEFVVDVGTVDRPVTNGGGVE